MKIIFCCLLIFALASAYAKSIGDVATGEEKDKEEQRKLFETMFKIAQASISQQIANNW